MFHHLQTDFSGTDLTSIYGDLLKRYEISLDIKLVNPNEVKS